MKQTLALLLFLVLLGSLLCACGQEEETTWDPIWTENFFLAAESQGAVSENAKDLRENVNATAEFPDLTLTVGQTLSDSRLLYIPLEITFPKDVDLSQFLSETRGQPSDYPMPEEISLVLATPEELAQTPNLSMNPFGRPSISVIEADLQKNSVTYFVSYENDTTSLSNRDVTLTLTNLSVTRDGKETPLAQGDYQVSWTTGSHDLLREFPIRNAAGEDVGHLALSPLGLWVELRQTTCTDAQELSHSTTLLQADGTQVPLSGDCGSGMKSDGTIEIHWSFALLLDLDSIDKVLVGEYEVNL